MLTGSDYVWGAFTIERLMIIQHKATGTNLCCPLPRAQLTNVPRSEIAMSSGTVGRKSRGHCILSLPYCSRSKQAVSRLSMLFLKEQYRRSQGEIVVIQANNSTVFFKPVLLYIVSAFYSPPLHRGYI